MTTPSSTMPPMPRRRPLAVCVAMFLTLTAPEAIAANTWPVANCNDSGPGSLRAVVAAPTTLSGDTVDMSQLSCSTVTLTTGAIAVAQNDLTIKGPSATRHAVVTGYDYSTHLTENDRVFNHTGTGTFGLMYMDVTYGSVTTSTAQAKGGCIYSSGNVSLFQSTVLSCQANATGHEGYGGGIFASGNVSVKYGQIVGNKVTSYHADGGGVSAGGTFSALGSTINGNSSSGGGGGIATNGGASIDHSTISGNTAYRFGGMEVGGLGSSNLLIVDSTISGNTATGNAAGSIIGGIETAVPTSIRNSTIAFNTAARAMIGGSSYAPGLSVLSGNGGVSVSVDIQSSILSNNTYGTNEGDFSVVNINHATTTITGANNLVRVSLGPQPAPTSSTACPLLGPLRNNGGATQTHALMSRSPAIDAGNNAANLTTDQRGAGFLRISAAPPGGTAPTVPDIGAYEVQQNDILFNSGFDGCP